MRSGFSEAAVAALTEAVSYKFNAKLNIYKSRIYFSTYDNHAPTYANEVADAGNPLAEAMIYIPSIDKVVSVVANEDSNIALLLEGSDTSLEITDGGETLSIAPGCRPGIWSNYIFWFDGIDWRRASFDVDLLVSETAECVLTNISYLAVQDISNGAIYPTSVEESVIMTFDKGGIRPIFIDSVQEQHISPARFMNPITVLDPDTNSDDIYLVHFAGATQVASGLFVYLSHYDGSVKAIKYTFSSNGKDGSWSDIQTAIPQDLSTFKISNVFEVNDRIFIAGRFARREEFSTSKFWTLLSWSDDGFIFSMDRKVLCSGIDLRFMVACDGENDIVFSASNRTYREVPPYQLIGENTTSTQTELLGVNGGVMGEFTCRLKSGKEEYFDIPYIDTGSYCRLDIGIFTGAEFEYIKYHDIVISGIDKMIRDGSRSLTLTAMPDGIWHTSNMTYPFYMEFQGRQGIYDAATDFSNFFKASTGMGPSWSLSCDFWTLDNGEVFQPQTHAADQQTDWWGPDLLTLCSTYPEISSDGSFVFSIYGWSRGGVPDSNPNTADSTPTNTPNDDFYALIEVLSDDGTKETIVSSVGELTSDFANPPQTYFPAEVRDGSYPVVFSIATPGEGKKIVRIGARVISATGNTTYYLERVEMPGISCNLIPADIDTATFDVVTNNQGWRLVDTINLTVTTGNASDGDHVTGSYDTNSAKVYAIAIVGNTSFKRGGINYKQDATYETHSGIASQNSALKIESGENPLFDTGRVIWDDSIPLGTEQDKTNHNYIFHIDQSLRWNNSSIPAKYVPYVFGDGNKIEAQFYLAGSGSISNLENPEFTIYVFESPDNFADFRFYGSGGLNGGGQFRIYDVVAAGGNWTSGNGVDADFLQFTQNISSWPEAPTAQIRNFNLFPIDIYVTINVHVDQILEIDAPSDTGIDGYSGTDYDVFVIKSLAPAAGSNWSVFPTGTFPSSGTIKITFQSTSSHGSMVPVPDSFSLSIPSITTVSDTSISTAMVNRRKGIPQIMFSSRPYSAFNFETIVRYSIRGNYSYAGIIGLGTDEKNFILGYIKSGEAGIAIVRAGRRTIIITLADSELDENTLYDVRFWHRDGLFGLEYKLVQDFWPERGSMLSHEWEIDDGPLAASDDVFHIGAYSHLDPPRFRTTGFRSSQNLIGVMPLDIDDTSGTSDFLTIFPGSGRVDIDGIKYNYSSLYNLFNPGTPMGPFGLRNITNWSNPFNKDPDGAHTYQGGKAIEFTQFQWFSGDTHALDFANYPVASSAGYAWLDQQTMWKAWITTGGALVYLRNRARHYSTGIPDYYPSGDEKIWICNALGGVSLVDGADQEYYHPSGTFCYFDSNDEVQIFGFIGTSGDHDQSIMTLLKTFCETSGTHADFPGDLVIPTVILAEDESVDLNE